MQPMEPQIHQLAPDPPPDNMEMGRRSQLHHESAAPTNLGAPISFDSGCGRLDRSSNSPFYPPEKYNDSFDCFLSSTPMHPIDSDDDCSIISALSFDDDITLEPDDSLHDVPQDIQDSIQKGIHDRDFEAATVISSACDSCLTMSDGSACDYDDAMSTASSILDDILSLGSDHSLLSQSVWNRVCHFDHLPNELLLSIASYLDVQSLSRARLVNKRFLSVASLDEAGWKQHCTILWNKKANVSKHARSLLQSGNARKAFYFASRDAVSRHAVLREELCFNPDTREGIIWSFRFKATAGAEWTLWDPWWTGANDGKAQEMVFLQDGRVLQYIRGTHFGEDDRLVMPFHNSENRPNGLDVRWRFLSQPMDLPKRPEGSYLRLTIAGRDVPTYVVHRSPTGNWAFVLESCWSVFASFSFAKRKQPHTITHAIERPPRMRLRRTTHGEARWLNVADMESDDEAENEDSLSGVDSPDVLEDSALSVTTAWQWREAILHNQGLVSLPEGESAAAEFDRAYWGQSRH